LPPADNKYLIELKSSLTSDPGKYDKEVVGLLDKLLKTYERAQGSQSFATGRDKVLSDLEKVIRELAKTEKRDSKALLDAIKSLSHQLNVSTKGLSLGARREITGVEVLDRSLKDLGRDLKKIMKEYGEREAIAIDLETSAGKFDRAAAEFGKKAAVSFITEIAYKKGKLKDLIEPGKIEPKRIYVRPPELDPSKLTTVEKRTEAREKYYDKLATRPGGDVDKKLREKLEKIGVPFEKLLDKEAKEVKEALSSLAKELKDAEIVVGHNIAGFDLPVLKTHFEKAGIKLEEGVDKFIDTLYASRSTFPERSGDKPHSLDAWKRSFVKAGEKFEGELHEAGFDVKLTTEKVMSKLIEGSKGIEGLDAHIDKLTEKIKSATADFDNVSKDVSNLSSSIDDATRAVGSIKKVGKNLTIDINKMSSVRSGLQAAVYRPEVVRPSAAGYAMSEAKGVPGTMELSGKVSDLAKSLDKLQNNIVTALEKGLSKGMQVVKDEAGEAFKLATGEREYELRIADVRGLRDALADMGQKVTSDVGAKELMDRFKTAFTQASLQRIRTEESMANEIFVTLGKMTTETASTMGRTVEQLFKDVRDKKTGVADIAGRADLQELFKNVALETKAQRELNDKYIKRLTLPAAKLGESGSLTFETKYGSQRVLSNFATVTTGLEKLVNEIKSLGAEPMETERLMREVSKVPLRPTPGGPEEAKANELAKRLIDRATELGSRAEVGAGYRRAIAERYIETGMKPEEARKVLDSSTGKELTNLMQTAEQLGVTALDVAKSLDSISFENVYDVIDKLYKSGKIPYLQKQAANIGKFDKNLRDVSGVVNDVLGLMPLAETARPQRTAFDESQVRIFTKAMEDMRPSEQKQHVMDVAMLWEDMAKRAERLGTHLFEDKSYLGIKRATPLDLSDAASSQLKQFNKQLTGNLKELDKTMVAMGTADIRGGVPFQQFSSLARQMSYTRRGLTGGIAGGGDFETPSLMSARERASIRAGQYGAGGYGLNVLTEIRDSAATFEDQIVISGRLAKAFTEVVKEIVRPAQTLAEGTKIKTGLKRLTGRGEEVIDEEEFNKMIGNVSDEIQKILGVSDTYRGRADIAKLSDEVVTVMREHRGKTIEVQTAKLTETFLNYFGRKFATRFGTKGVSVTPSLIPTDIKEFQDVARSMAAGLEAKVMPGEGLGYAKIPKSVGQMVSELLSESIGSLHTEQTAVELHNRLIESGNKFVIGMFKDARKGLVTKEEAEKNRKLFEQVSKIWEDTFKAGLPTGPGGIKEIRELYKTGLDREPFVLKPIEARIGARGIAKRGLQTEILEGIVNNLIGTGKGSTELVDKIGKGALVETKEARQRLNEYLEALGYQTIGSLEQVRENLTKKFPKLDEGQINKLVNDFESQWSVYTDVLNEFQKQTKSFVAPKFLQIIEEPQLFKDWSPREIEKGLKGAKLDFQSFSAMAGIFGEGSKMMQELASSTTLASKEGWELIRAFQMLDPTMKDMNRSLLTTMKSIDLKDIKTFEDSTGSLEDFKDTIFDISKFPTAFKTLIPSTTPGKQYEELFVPGPAARGTYEEPLLGERAPTNIARYLSNFVNAAREVQQLQDIAAGGELELSDDFQNKFAETIKKELIVELTDAINQFKKISKQGYTPETLEYMQKTIDRFMQGFSETRPAAPIWQEGGQVYEKDVLEAFIAKQGTREDRFIRILGRMADMLVGKRPETVEAEYSRLNAALKQFKETGNVPEEFQTSYYTDVAQRSGGFENMIRSFMARTQREEKAAPIFDIVVEDENLGKFIESMGLNIQKTVGEALQLKRETLTKAKRSYYKALGEEVIGRKKGVEQVFFRRTTPAVTGKAISAIADKTFELKMLLDVLESSKHDISLDIPNIDKLIEDTKLLSETHEDYVTRARQLGMPVLKEGEIGIPATEAAKLKVRSGGEELNLKELIKNQGEAYVESLRYPFTGTLSVQPHKAKLMEGGLGKYSIAVPGAPQLDLVKLNEIVGTLREYVGLEKPGKHLEEGFVSLIEQREKAWSEHAKGSEEAGKKAMELTDTIEGIIDVINDVIPKFRDHEQKLDFDGDALFVHTGQVEESRKEIEHHFDALGKDVTSVRSLFRNMFTQIKDYDVQSFAEMAAVFSKKHPGAKGFEFLQKPYIEEEMKHLKRGDVMGALFSYQPQATNLKESDKEWKSAVSEWSKKFVTQDILPEVFSRLGVSAEAREGYLSKVKESKGPLPEAAEVSTQLETRITNLADELVRRQLWEKRYADAISGQLYKFHTGQTVEGISRVARLSEIETGFGSGLAGTGKKATPSAEFLSKWPETSIALGGRPVQEFAQRVNEVMRFVIQKGMDVKHAGTKAVGEDIIANIGKESGAEMIMMAMEEAKDQFSELADFNEQIKKSVELRLGAFSTEDVRKELQRFKPDIDMAELAKMDRQTLINRIASHVDLGAVFEELFRQIRRQSVRALSKQLEQKVAEMPVGPGRLKLERGIRAAGGVEQFASEKIAKEAASESGISLFKYVTTSLQPLYRMRTSMETMASTAKRTGVRFEKEDMYLPEGQMGKDIMADMDKAKKSAHVFSRSLSESVKDPMGGVHKFLVVSALQQRYKELEELQKLEASASKYTDRPVGLVEDLVDVTNITRKVFTEAGSKSGLVGGKGLGVIPPKIEDMEELFGRMKNAREIMKEQTERYAEIAGLPPLTPEERQGLELDFFEKFGEDFYKKIEKVVSADLMAGAKPGEEIDPKVIETTVNEYYSRLADFWKFQLGIAEQLRRVSEVIKTVPMQREYLSTVLPELNKAVKEMPEAQKNLANQHKEYGESIKEFYRQQKVSSGKGIEQAMKDIPVATAAADELKEEAVRTTDDMTKAITASMVKRKRDALKYLESQAAGKATGEAPLHKIFRASAVHGGGKYGGGTQVEAILGEMLGMPKDMENLLEATAFRGTALHRRRQKEFLKEYPTAQIEKPVEDAENKITGHIDVLYEKAGQQIVADIKTVYSSRAFERLEKIAKEVNEGKITIQDKIKQLKSSELTNKFDKDIIRRLEDYISQVNVYLKNVEGAVGELVIVSTLDPKQELTIPIGAFDPERFKKDVDAINEAKIRVARAIDTLATTGGLPEDLLRDFPKIYEYLAKQLEKMGTEEFVKTLPTRPVGEVEASSQEILDRLNNQQEDLFDRLSREYLEIYRRSGPPKEAERKFKRLYMGGRPAAGGAGAGGGMPPTPPTGGGPGDGDDFEEFLRKIQDLLAKAGSGRELDLSEVIRLIEAWNEAQERYNAAQARDNEEMANVLQTVINSISNALEEAGVSYEAYKKIADMSREFEKAVSGMPDIGQFSKVRTQDIERIMPDRPEAMHKNLRALYEAAIRVNKLSIDKDMEKYGPEIVSLLKETAEEGPYNEVSQRIADAMSKLPPEKKGGMRKIWQFYKKSVGEYFLNRLDELEKEINQEAGTPQGRKAYIEYEQTLEKYLANIRGTLTHVSDIYTTEGPSGKKTKFVDPELARLVGIYRTPAQLEAKAADTAGLPENIRPIMQALVGDLDATQLEQIATPLEKVRTAFKMLTEVDPAMKEILSDADLFRRLGDQAIEAWDFESLVGGVTHLRAALQSYNRMQVGGFGGMGDQYTEAVRKNVEDTITYLKQLEKMFAPIGGAAASPMGTVGVPPFLDPQTQSLLHKRNIAAIQEYYRTPEAKGGPESGQAFTYRYKIVDPTTKQVLSNMAEEFRKLGEEATRSGERVGIFTQRTEDLVRAFQDRKGIGQAFARVLKWGFASRTVYGIVGALKSMVNTIADVETGITVLRQVMSPLTTDFDQLTQSAIDFAKSFGLPINQVIESMRVFAQQGLAQSEVVDRTRTSMLAANVTTLKAADATEAITAAMKVYGKEGQSTLRFLDAWSEVEARHAITSGDLANAMKKAAAVAKTSGVTFDEFNAIVTGIGETSRQTGKEIGTSLRFMFRRIQGEKGPKELMKVGIPVITEEGDLRSAFDILGDLSDRWGELTNAQRLNIATAIGGRRHYNNLIILMDHWNDVLDTLEDSINSKGAAERRNAIVMETYAKKLQQVRSSLTELQVQFGKFALPVAKAMLDSLKFVIEAIANIPPGLKMATLAFAGLFAAVAKGDKVIDVITTRFDGFMSVFGDFVKRFSKQFKIGIFETFGKLPKGFADIDTRGLSVIGKGGEDIKDFESIIGKAAFKIAEFGRGWNSVMSEIAYTGTATSETIGKAFGGIGSLLGGAAIRAGKASPILGGILETMSLGAEAGESGFMKLASLFGISSEALAEWSTTNAGFIKSVGPLAGSLAALVPISGKVFDQFKKLAFSADQYEESMAGLDRKLSEDLDTITGLSTNYDRLNRSLKKASEFTKPEVRERAIRRDEYISPLLELGKAEDNYRDFANNLSKHNMDMVVSFDEFGNAVLNSAVNFQEAFRLMKASKVKEIAENDIKVLEKYAEELTNAGTFVSKFKSELKKFASEIPAIGPMIADLIQVSPAQELEEAVDNVNRILSKSAKYPMTTAFNDIYGRYMEQLEEARGRFEGFYSDFKRILADLSTEGLSAAQIKGLIDREAFEKGFELMTQFEGRIKALTDTGYKINWKDILGVEILKRINTDVTLDYAAPLTKELLRQSGIVQREGKAFVGDIVLFTEDIDDQFQTAGRQGILKFNDELQWFVETINKDLRTVEKIPLNTIENFVDSIFPATKIADTMEENLNILEEQIVGAAAGMVAIGNKEFRRQFGLGSRFFSQIPTETLIQTTQGFTTAPGGGGRFGVNAFKESFMDIGFPELVSDFFIKPMEELKTMIEEPTKRLGAQAGLGPGLEENIRDLISVIKNNQSVVQLQALYVDLEKAESAASMALRENIEVEKMRNKVLLETSGILAGLPSDISDINLGIKSLFELTPQQRVLFEERTQPVSIRYGRTNRRPLTMMGARERLSEFGLQRQASVERLERLTRFRVQANTIIEQASAQKNIVSKEEMDRIKEAMVSGIEPERFKEIDIQKRIEASNSSIRDNTALTNKKMDDLLAALSDDKATDKAINQAKTVAYAINQDIGLMVHGFEKVPKALMKRTEGAEDLSKDLPLQFDRLATLRNQQSKKGNVELVRYIDNIMTDSSRKLIDAFGISRAAEMVESKREIPLTRLDIGGGRFGETELLRRSLGAESLRSVVQRIEEMQAAAKKEEKERTFIEKQFIKEFERVGKLTGVRPEKDMVESTEFKSLVASSRKQNKVSIASTELLGKFLTGFTLYNNIFKRSAERQERGYRAQMRELQKQRQVFVERRKSGEISQEEFRKGIDPINKEYLKVAGEARKSSDEVSKRQAREAAGLIGRFSLTFAKSIGVNKKALDAFGGAAAGALIGWTAWESLTGQELPKTVKNATGALKDWSDKLGDEGLNWWEKLKFGVGKFIGGEKSLSAAVRAGASSKALEKFAEKEGQVFTPEEQEEILKKSNKKLTDEEMKRSKELIQEIASGDKEKLTEDEKLAKVNQDQLTTLIAIEENTRTSAEGLSEDAVERSEKSSESMTRVLRDKLDEIKKDRLLSGGDTAARLRDLVAVLTVLTGSEYLAGKTRLKGELGVAEDIAKDIEKDFVALFKKYPEEMKKLMEEERRRVSEEGSPAPGGVVKTERSRYLKTFEALAQIQSEIDRLIKDEEEAAKKFLENEQSIKILLRTYEIAGEELQKTLTTIVGTLIESTTELSAARAFGGALIGAGIGAGGLPEIPRGRLGYELRPEERLFKRGGPWGNMLDSFTRLSAVRDSLLELMKQNAVEIAESNITAESSLNEQRSIIETGKLSAENAAKEMKNLQMKSEDLKNNYEESVKALDKFTGPGVSLAPGSLDKSKALMESQRKSLATRSDEYAKEIDKYNEALRTSGALGVDELSKSVRLLIMESAAAQDNLMRQADYQNKVVESLKLTNTTLKDLNDVLVGGLGIQDVISDFDRLQSEFTAGRLSSEFERAFEMSNIMRLGGEHPEAPQLPTFEMLQAGVPLDKLFTMTRAQQKMIEIQMRTGRGPTKEEVQRIQFDDLLKKRQIEQTKYDEDLNRERAQASSLYASIVEAMQRAGTMTDTGLRDDLISGLENIRQNLVKQAEAAPERTGRMISEDLGIYELEGFKPEKIRQQLQELFTRYRERPEVEAVEGAFSSTIDKLTSKFPELNTPVIQILAKSNTELSGIRSNTKDMISKLDEVVQAILTGEVKKPDNIVYGPAPEFSQATLPKGAPMMPGRETPVSPINAGGGKPRTFWDFIKDQLAIDKGPSLRDQIYRSFYKDITQQRRSMGGVLNGPGGPRDDKIPILASNGEYVINTKSARSLGYGTLDYMNKTGMLPGMQTGGSLDDVIGKEIRRRFEEYMAKGGRKTVGDISMFRDVSGEWVMSNRPYMYSEQLASMLPLLGVKPGDFKFSKNIPKAGDGEIPTAKGVHDLLKENPSLSNPLELINRDLPGGSKSTALRKGKLHGFLDKAGEWVITDRPSKYQSGGDISKEEFLSGVIRAPKKGEEFWRAIKEVIPFTNFKEKSLNDPNALMNQSAMLADMALPGPGKLGIFKKLGAFAKPLIGRASKLTSKLFPRALEMAGTGVSRKASKAVYGAATEEQLAAYEKRLARSTEFADFIRENLSSIPGMTANIDVGSIRDSLMVSGKNIGEAMRAWSDIAKQLTKINKYVGLENVDLKEIIVRDLPKTTYGAFTPTKGRFSIAKHLFKDPIKTRQKFVELVKHKHFAYMDPDKAFKEAFSYVPSHEVGGHAYTLRENMEEVAMRVSNTAKSAFKSGKQKVKGSFISGRATANPKEFMAEAMASALHTPSEKATKLVQSIKKLKGIPYQEGGPVTRMWEAISEKSKETKGFLANLWESVIGRSKPIEKGEITSVFEAAEGLERVYGKKEQIMKELFDEKGVGGMLKKRYQEGGLIESLWGTISEKSDEAKNVFAKIWGSVIGRDEPIEKGKITSVFEAGAGIKRIKGRRQEMMKELFGEDVEQYKRGTPYVPSDQMAYVHKGEAIIPAEYNLGGMILDKKRYQMGGEVGGRGVLRGLESAGEKIGEAVVKKLEEAEIKVRPPDPTDIPKLEIEQSSLEDLSNVLNNIGTGAVGADGTNRIDEFIESATEKFDRIEEKTIDNDDRISIVETSTEDFNTKLENISNTVNEYTEKIKGMEESVPEELEERLEKIENSITSSTEPLETRVTDLEEYLQELQKNDFVKSSDDNSNLERRLHELYVTIMNEAINPINANISRIELILSNFRSDLDDQYDRLHSNVNRIGLDLSTIRR